MNCITKLRAFQLDSEGSLFSFYKKDEYTLIEARIPKGGIEVLQKDLALHKKSTIDLLHITSWDKDHCNYDDLVKILNSLRPAMIQVPPYEPDTEVGKLCRNVIFKYDDIHQRYINNVQIVTREFIQSLPHAQLQETNDVMYYSLYNAPVKNDMSLIRLFRSDGFNVLSPGDCESEELSQNLQRDPILRTEVDVLILPHHGADNGFTSGKFLDALNPRIAICSSNYDNKFDHPAPSVCGLLSSRGIPVMTTKRGDVIIFQQENDEKVIAINLISDNEKSETPVSFNPKRSSRNQRAA